MTFERHSTTSRPWRVPRRAARPRLPLFAVLFALVLTTTLLGLAGSAVAAPTTTSVTTPAPTTTTSIVLGGAAKQQVGGLQTQAAAVQAEIDKLDVQLAMLTESYNQLNGQIDSTNIRLIDLRRQLRQTQAKYQDRRDLINQRIVGTYKAGENGMLEVLLASDDFSGFVKRLYLLFKVTQNDNSLAADLQRSVTDLAALNASVEEVKRQGLALRVELEAKRGDIEGLLAERTNVMASLDSRIVAVIEQERQRQEAERQRLEAELKARLAASGLSVGDLYRGPLPQTADEVLNQVIQTAAAYLGIPYVWGGDRPSIGMDCSGFTMYVYRQHGITLPHFAADQQQMGVAVSEAEALAGDLVFFGDPAYHVALYIGDGKIIEAPRTGDVIRVTPLAEKSNVSGFRRFPLTARTGDPTQE
jgi:peptidoglycan DL-endopeptidase CwlO